MTVHTEPSSKRTTANHEILSGNSRWASSDWVVPSTEDLRASDVGLSGAPLNAADISTSGLDVTIDTFEAWIGGAYVASDDSTASEHTHTLPGNSTTTTLYLGYDFSAVDTILFGPASDFAAADPKIPVADVTDDGSSVTSTQDRRPVGLTPRRGILVDSIHDADDTTSLSLDTGTLGTSYDTYEVVIYREDQASSTEDYQSIRINGASTSNYYADIYDATDNSHTSFDAATEWGRIAGVGEDGGAVRYGGIAHQVIHIDCPREVVSNGQHYPTISVVKSGVGKNISLIDEGVFTVDTARVDQVAVRGSNNATGYIEIYGRAASHGAPRWF